MENDHRNAMPGEPLRSAEPFFLGETEASAADERLSPLIRPAAVAAPPKTAHPVLYPGLTWVLGVLVGLMVLRYFLPFLVEEIQYSITRGEQRAKYEAAGEHLNHASLNELSLAYQMVSQRVAPSVVHIRTVRVDDSRAANDEYQRLFGRVSPHEAHGQGSGVIVDAAGYIVTNHHVVHGARDVEVQLSDGRILPAEIVGVDAATDMAVLKIKSDGLIAAAWGNSDKLEVGSLVWAVGSPFGLDRSITSGILSAKNRRGIARSNYQDFLQTDAAVNPGNSGGPLVDVEGRVIGINTAIIGESFQGISFALPSNIAHDIYEKLKTDRRVARGWLGVGLEEVTLERASKLKLPAAKGVYVPHVLSDRQTTSPAAAAGMKAGDVILKWDGHEVENPLALSRLVAGTKIGIEVEVIVWRDQQEVPLRVIVGERPMDLN